MISVNFLPCRLLAAALPAIFAVVASAAVTGGGERLDPLDPLARPAVTTRNASTSVLIAIARAGSRLVATGESGLILLSDDNGQHWRQAKVPVSVTLTAVTFATPRRGWAVGHSGVILATDDGGETWMKQLDGRQLTSLPLESGPSAQDGASAFTAADPLLDVLFLDESNGFAVGAFGMFLHTTDGGAHWVRAGARIPNPDGNHLYGIRRIGARIYVAGERGSAFVSSDQGAHFTALKTPYEGSFFGVAGSTDGRVVLFGLQGKAFVSADQGTSWQPIKSDATGAWTGAARLPDQRLVLVGQAGDVLVENRAGGRFQALPGDHPSLSAVTATVGGVLVGVGPRGILNITSPSDTTGGTEP